MSVNIRGRGTNIIFEGDVEGGFPASQSPMHIGFSNGAVISACFDADGYFSITRVVGDDEHAVVTPRNEDSSSDRVEILGDIEWAVGGYNFVTVPPPVVEQPLPVFPDPQPEPEDQ